MGYLKEKIPDSRVQRMMETLFSDLSDSCQSKRSRNRSASATVKLKYANEIQHTESTRCHIVFRHFYYFADNARACGACEVNNVQYRRDS